MSARRVTVAPLPACAVCGERDIAGPHWCVQDTTRAHLAWCRANALHREALAQEPAPPPEPRDPQPMGLAELHRWAAHVRRGEVCAPAAQRVERVLARLSVEHAAALVRDYITHGHVQAAREGVGRNGKPKPWVWTRAELAFLEAVRNATR